MMRGVTRFDSCAGASHTQVRELSPSAIKQREEALPMLKATTPDDSFLRCIVQKRLLPGLLLLDAQGKLLSWNSIARQILLPEGNYLPTLQQIRRHLVTLREACLQRRSSSKTSKAPLMQELLYSKRRWYGLQVFGIDNHAGDRFSLVAVLLEEINPSRLDLRKAQRLFGLPPRQIETIQALQAGMTDKEIASTLGVSPETVRGYLKSIRAKLGVANRTAILHKLLSL